MSNIRELNLEENLSIAEAMKKSVLDGSMGLGGAIAIEDPATSRILQVRENKLTLRGRSFALENIFKSDAPVDSDYISNLAREVVMFRIGTGGAPASQPFVPTPPSAGDSEMALPAPFRVVDPNVECDDMCQVDVTQYSDARPLSGEDAGKTGYFAKAFDGDSEFVWNPADNKVYRHLRLLISAEDARDLAINEAGLVIADPNDFSGMELFSRVTFASEFMGSDTQKALLIHYYVYA